VQTILIRNCCLMLELWNIGDMPRHVLRIMGIGLGASNVTKL
jgi:hypothetical protein